MSEVNIVLAGMVLASMVLSSRRTEQTPTGRGTTTMTAANQDATNISNGIKGYPWDANGWLFDVGNTGRDSFWEKRAMTTCAVAAVFYVIVSFGALAYYAGMDMNAAQFHGRWRLLAIGIGVFVSAGPPLFFWSEARAFDRWLNAKIPDVEKQKSWRETYKLNADNARAFWAAVLAVYAAVLLIKP